MPSVVKDSRRSGRAANGAEASGVRIRPLANREDYVACVELQELIWGAGEETIPPIMLQVSQKVGAIAAGAFDRQGRMLGCVFGLTGLRNGRVAHWSHLLAVRPEARDQGIGRRLKRYQRSRLLAKGVTTMYWTFDPLVARNAHLNLNRLGAVVVEYKQNPRYPGHDDIPLLVLLNARVTRAGEEEEAAWED